MKKWLSLSLWLLLLSACGQTGPLYLGPPYPDTADDVTRQG